MFSTLFFADGLGQTCKQDFVNTYRLAFMAIFWVHTPNLQWIYFLSLSLLLLHSDWNNGNTVIIFSFLGIENFICIGCQGKVTGLRLE